MCRSRWPSDRLDAQAEAAEGAVHAAIAQQDGHADMGPDGQRPGLGNIVQHGNRARVGNQLRDLPLDHAHAVALFERVGLARPDGRRIQPAGDMAEDPVAAVELGHEGHVHVEVAAHRIQHAVHVAADGRGAGTAFKPGVGQQCVVDASIDQGFLLKTGVRRSWTAVGPAPAARAVGEDGVGTPGRRPRRGPLGRPECTFMSHKGKCRRIGPRTA